MNGWDHFMADLSKLFDLPNQLAEMGAVMASAKEQLNQLSTKVDDLINDVRAAKDTLEADRENLSTEGQAALDELTAKVDAFDAEVGDADGSDVPAPTPEPGGDTSDGSGTGTDSGFSGR